MKLTVVSRQPFSPRTLRNLKEGSIVPYGTFWDDFEIENQNMAKIQDGVFVWQDVDNIVYSTPIHNSSFWLE